MSKNINVRQMLQKVGITPEIRGYFYLVAGIETVKAEFKSGKPFDSYYDLYADIARTYDTTLAAVERCIRHAINRAFKKPTPTLEKLFDGKPSNSTFIAVIAERLILIESEE